MKKGINDMKETARLAALILCLILVTQALACSGASDTSVQPDLQNNSASDETTTGIITANLPDTNWEGREFRVLGYVDDTYPQFSNFEIYSDGETGEVVNDEYIAATEL